MQRSTSWLAALATAAGRLLGIADSGPILPVSINSTGSEPVGFLPAAAAMPPRMQADKWSTMAEAGSAATSFWLEVDRKLPFSANPLTGAAAGAY